MTRSNDDFFPLARKSIGMYLAAAQPQSAEELRRALRCWFDVAGLLHDHADTAFKAYQLLKVVIDKGDHDEH